MKQLGRERKGQPVAEAGARSVRVSRATLPSSRWIGALRRALLSFYDEARRDLPWRRTRDPYRIWVSEVMLQQTRAETVIPYYERWIAQFPTVEALASAPADRVLKAWEGLGYYSRARNLHRAARLVRERHAGSVPPDAASLRALPGVGEYTAGAVASIAFGAAEPAVDGNVRRVLARLLDEAEPSPARLRRVASAIVPTDRPGDFNQALMELGAMRCTPRAPACGRCPVSRQCRARRAGTQLERPQPRAKRAVPVYDLGTAVVAAGDGRILLERRPDGGLLGGLFAFPAAVIGPGEAAESAARRSVPFALGGAAVPVGVVEHTFTHRRERYHAFLWSGAAPEEGGGGPETLRWFDPREIEAAAMPVAQRRVLRLARSALRPREGDGRQHVRDSRAPRSAGSGRAVEYRTADDE